MTSQWTRWRLNTIVSIVYSSVCSGADQAKHQSSASLAFVRGIHRWPANSHTKGQQRGKCFHLITSSCTRNTNYHMWYNLVGSSGGRLFPPTSFCPVFPDNCVRNNQDHINPDFYSSKSSHNIKRTRSVPNIPCHNRYAVLRGETSSPDIYDAGSTDETRRCHSSTGNPPAPRLNPVRLGMGLVTRYYSAEEVPTQGVHCRVFTCAWIVQCIKWRWLRCMLLHEPRWHDRKYNA